MATNDTVLQVRTNKSDKEQAAEILDQLGTNLSTVVNMLIRQIVLTKSIPFEVKLPESFSFYTDEEAVREVANSMSLEGMYLTEEDLGMLRAVQAGDVTGDELRARIVGGN